MRHMPKAPTSISASSVFGIFATRHISRDSYGFPLSYLQSPCISCELRAIIYGWFILHLLTPVLGTTRWSSLFSSLTVLSSYPVMAIDQRAKLAPDKVLAMLEDDNPPPTTYRYTQTLEQVQGLLQSYIDGEKFNELNASSCIDEYAVSFLTSRGGVFLVHELEEDDELLMEQGFLLKWKGAYFDNPGSAGFDETFGWICPYLNYQEYERCRPLIDGVRNNASNWQPAVERTVKYCLSRPIENQLCRVNFNIPLAIGVIISNLVKMVILGYIALYLAPDRLLVLGDAVQSFLARPDPFTRQSCLASMRLVRDSFTSRGAHWSGARSLFRVSKRWITPVGKRRVGVGVVL
jgi:hypothetical protein